MKNFRYFIFSLALIFLSCKTEKIKQAGLKDEHRKPNIILILSDDQGWGDLSYSGNTNIKTPNIDGIAKNGVSFENFFVQPVCSPSRAELLTGRHFPLTGVYSTSAGGERMNFMDTTLPDVLLAEGYATAAYGKWHNGMQPPYHPNARGFSDFYGFASGHWGNYFSPMLEHNGKIVKGEGYLADDLTNHGLDFITQHKETPFFLYLPLNTPHSPMQVPDKFWNTFEDKKLENQYQGSEKEDLDFTKAALAMVENIDYNVGRILQKLETLNLSDNTIVIYLSDNGPNSDRFNGGMRGIKGSTDEGGVRTPFFIQWKETLPKGKKIFQIASALDILPTLAALTKSRLQTENTIDGTDLTRLLFEEQPQWEDRSIFNFWNGESSIRTQNYRLDAENRLYDMVTDRGQTIDITAQYPKLRDSLMHVKEAWAKKMTASENHERPFTLGHPYYKYTQLPARDGIPHGKIKRSNKYPNDTYFTNWKSINDSITWDVDVLAKGVFGVELYYTCSAENVGAVYEIKLGASTLQKKITKAFDPPLIGKADDRIPRKESYVKDFEIVKFGQIALEPGHNTLTLKALNIVGGKGIDVRLLMFKRIGETVSLPKTSN